LRQPLDDNFDLQVRGQQSLTTFVSKKNMKKPTVKIENLPDMEVVLVQVFPVRHRPVAAFAPRLIQDAGVELFSPVDPARARPKFPGFQQLPEILQTTLTKSVIEGGDPAMSGKALYDGLDPLSRAGLLNLFTKMSRTGLPGGRTAWSFVSDLYRIRPDRIFANVDLTFRDAVKTAEQAGLFSEAPSALHTPPPAFRSAGSFKSIDPTGNLQLTFFVAEASLTFKIDADIDNANGIGHIGQLVQNAFTGGTNPYDIHQILSFGQHMTMPYEVLT